MNETEVIDAAEAVWKVGQKKGSLYVTQKGTRSDALIGFFVPVAVMADLASAIGQFRTEQVDSLPPVRRDNVAETFQMVMEGEYSEVWEADFWIGLSIGLFIALVVSLIWWWQL